MHKHLLIHPFKVWRRIRSREKATYFGNVPCLLLGVAVILNMAGGSCVTGRVVITGGAAVLVKAFAKDMGAETVVRLDVGVEAAPAADTRG